MKKTNSFLLLPQVNSLAFTQQPSGEQLMKEGFQVEIRSGYMPGFMKSDWQKRSKIGISTVKKVL
jgi:hypothetical protein